MNKTTKTQRAEAAAASARSWGNLANALAGLWMRKMAKGHYLQTDKIFDSAQFARSQSVRARARLILEKHS